MITAQTRDDPFHLFRSAAPQPLFLLRRLLQTAALIGALACTAYLFFRYPLPRTTPAERFNLLYNLPLYSLLCFWLYYRAEEATRIPLLALDGLVVACAAARLWGDVHPASGHALLLSYSLLTVPHRFYRVAAALLLALTIALKLAAGDQRSWLYGIAFGLLCAGARRMTSRLPAQS